MACKRAVLGARQLKAAFCQGQRQREKTCGQCAEDQSIAVWRLFTDLDLSDAKQLRFDSLNDCFTRELLAGARVVDMHTDVLSSPCDAIVGACGRVVAGQVFQAKGFPYLLGDLFGPSQDTVPFLDGMYVTLRLTSSMYHRFHAPQDCQAEHLTHISGDTWNVNPIALARVQRLFCKNERALPRLRLAQGGHPTALVPVAAIQVARICLHFLNVLLHLKYWGANQIACNVEFKKGQEMGWFQHGLTIILIAPKGFALADGIQTGQQIKTG